MGLSIDFPNVNIANILEQEKSIVLNNFQNNFYLSIADQTEFRKLGRK
jgi:hypothetical protein